MTKMRQAVKNNMASVVLLAAGLAALCLFWLCRGNRAWMDVWLRTVSMPCKRAVSAAVDALPFSVTELCATLAILAELFLLGRCIFLAVKRQQNRFGAWLMQLAAVVVCIYALVCAFWGTQYYGTAFAEKAGMSAPPVSAAQLQAVTEYFAAQVNATANNVPRDEAGRFAVSKSSVFATSTGSYSKLLEQYPFLDAFDGAERRAKPAVYSKIMSAAGFTGYLCPLFGESTLNVDCPAVFLPVTITHEFAHQRGVAAEQEANFVGVQAAVTCADPVYNYSGWLFGYLHLSNALYGADKQAAVDVMQALTEDARTDLETNNAYWAKWEGPAKAAGETVYTAFLQSYDQTLGMKSYGACVDLLVEAYLPAALE